jgi:hypothetical protein
MLQNDSKRLPPFHFDADPDPAFHFDAVPDPASQNAADPCGSATLLDSLINLIVYVALVLEQIFPAFYSLYNKLMCIYIILLIERQNGRVSKNVLHVCLIMAKEGSRLY